MMPVLMILGCEDTKKPEPAGAAPSGAPSSSSMAKPAPTPTPTVGKELNLFAWSEYVPQSVIDSFSKETGIKVNYETYASNEEMLSKFLAGGTKYDLLMPSEYAVEALIKGKKLDTLDPAKLPNLKNLAPDMKNLAHDPDQRYTVPWMSGTVGIVVNTAKIKDPIKSFKDVFQDKYKGRIVVVNDNREMVSWAMSTLGIPVNDVTPENLAKVKPVLASWVKLVKVFDSDSPKTAFLGGDVDIGVIWSGEAALLYKQDKKYQFVLPAEGSHMAIDSLCIPVGAPNREGALMFMNYILKPDVSKQISEKFPYTNPNAEARKLLSAEDLANPASYPPLDKLGTFRDIGKAASDIDKLVTDLKSSL
jgi:spermidine/putrescine transport system substrate-binding protein